MRTSFYFETVQEARNYFREFDEEYSIELANWEVRKFVDDPYGQINNWIVVCPSEAALPEDEHGFTEGLGSVSDILY